MQSESRKYNLENKVSIVNKHVERNLNMQNYNMWKNINLVICIAYIRGIFQVQTAMYIFFLAKSVRLSAENYSLPLL